MQERSVPCVAIMDLHGGRPLPADYGGRGSMLRQRECPVHYVDTDLFDSRPGLAVLQVRPACRNTGCIQHWAHLTYLTSI